MIKMCGNVIYPDRIRAYSYLLTYLITYLLTYLLICSGLASNNSAPSATMCLRCLSCFERYCYHRTCRHRSFCANCNECKSYMSQQLTAVTLLPRDAIHKRGICRHAVSVRPSVCPSVCHVRELRQNE